MAIALVLGGGAPTLTLQSGALAALDDKGAKFELVAKLQSRAEFFYEGSWILRGVPRPVLVGWFCEEGTHNRA
jgi:hypothetical protein